MKKVREPVSRERILAAALEIVDAEGLGAVSMRRLGDALGVEAMSLYNHVPNKAAVLDGLFEAVLSEIEPVRRSKSWSLDLRHRARAFRAALLRHPHVAPLFATRPAVTLASLAHVEAALEVLREAGFARGEAVGVFQVLVAFVVGHTLGSTAALAPDAPAPVDYTSLDRDAFPRVRELADVLARYDVEREFELGLDLMIGGLEARLAAREGRAR
ncbi:MAG: TetR/AcrR family transcriptional regulator C-terminal domain-containing protein [Polyangiaceae bacterium]